MSVFYCYEASVDLLTAVKLTLSELCILSDGSYFLFIGSSICMFLLERQYYVLVYSSSQGVR
jgi:hypothetical protein